MIQSNQITTNNSYPLVKQSTLEEGGKVRVLSFDINFPSEGIQENEEILLVKLPKTDIKLIQVGFACSEADVDTTFDFILSSLIYDPINESYRSTKDDEVIREGFAMGSLWSSVLVLNNKVEQNQESNAFNYIKLKSSKNFSVSNILNGYILYVLD